MRITSVILLIFAAVMLSACASFTPHTYANGTQIDRAAVAFIKKGETTRAEVEKRFGQPDSIQVVEGGKRMAMYSYSATTAPMLAFGAAKVSTERTSLQLTYSQQGIVEDYEYSDSESANMVDNSLLGGGTITPVKKDAHNGNVKAVQNYKAQNVQGGLGTGGHLAVQGDDSSQSNQGQPHTAREEIIQAQKELNSLGFNVGTPDGRIGPRTRKELMAFQKSRKLPVTGKLDDETEVELAK